MNDDSTPQSVLFPELFGKRLVAQFDQPHGSSDGGAVLLKACDERLGLTERLSGCLGDEREPGKIRHTLEELIRQRVFAIACGYADCNDAARLAEDPIQKLLVGAIRSRETHSLRSRRCRASRTPWGRRRCIGRQKRWARW